VSDGVERQVARILERAYACDRAGDEAKAVKHYDAAHALGVPENELLGFLIGYGSTLRNVGRIDDSLAILSQGLEHYPDYAPLKAFLALALLSAGQPDAAVAVLLELALALHAVADDRPLDGYEGALARYQQELLERAVEARRR
jgi:tetratricopeptide (TPR) repeat protein